MKDNFPPSYSEDLQQIVRDSIVIFILFFFYQK